jgi:hypothetical protein
VRFRLHYSGSLHANADERRKHEIRRSIHPQLAAVWEPPVLNFRQQDWAHPTKRDRSGSAGASILYEPVSAMQMDLPGKSSADHAAEQANWPACYPNVRYSFLVTEQPLG